MLEDIKFINFDLKHLSIMLRTEPSQYYILLKQKSKSKESLYFIAKIKTPHKKILFALQSEHLTFQASLKHV